MRIRLSPLATWAIAIGAPVLAVVAAWSMGDALGTDPGYLPAIGAVLLAVAFGSGWHGAAATVVAVLVIVAGAGIGRIGAADAMSFSRLGIFAATGFAASALVESLHRARRFGEQARERERAARRNERALRAKFEALVAAIGDGIVVCEADGHIRLANEAARRLIGPVEDWGAMRSLFLADEAGGPAPMPAPGDAAASILAYQPDGARWVELTSYPVDLSDTPDDTPGSVLLLRDVTAARQRARLREAFIGLLSHELRTPVTAIYGGATMLRRDSRLDPAARRALLADLAAESDRLGRLVEDLLVLARVEEGVEVGLEPLLLQHLVPEIVEGHRQDHDERAIELRVEPALPPVSGDETSIGQVLRNLLTNAAKYSPEGSPIAVEVSANGTDVEVRVQDRGRGISEDEAAQVFDAFYRSTGAQRMASGVGLGLFVCRRLVEAMGGRVWARPRFDGGSEFGFALRGWQLDPDEPVERALIGVG